MLLISKDFKSNKIFSLNLNILQPQIQAMVICSLYKYLDPKTCFTWQNSVYWFSRKITQLIVLSTLESLDKLNKVIVNSQFKVFYVNRVYIYKAIVLVTSVRIFCTALFTNNNIKVVIQMHTFLMDHFFIFFLFMYDKTRAKVVWRFKKCYQSEKFSKIIFQTKTISRKNNILNMIVTFTELEVIYHFFLNRIFKTNIKISL